MKKSGALGCLEVLVGMALAVANARGQEKEPEVGPRAAEFFERQVRPVLAEHCFPCHSDQKQKAGLRLDSKAAVFKGSEAGPVVVPGEPDKSALIRAIRYQGEIKMPPKGKLPDEAVNALTIWVKRGVFWPPSRNVAPVPASSEPIAAAARSHWAFQPVQKPPIPVIPAQTQPQTAVDAFVREQLLAKGMKPSKPADRRTLIRRATSDLTGLPPTPEEVEAFVDDPSLDAFDKVI